jgi:hypothetical protein
MRFAFLTKRPSCEATRRRGGLGHRLLDDLVDLVRSHLLLDADLCRQQFLGKVQWHVCRAFIVVLGNPLLDLRLEVGIGGDQRAEGLGGQSQQCAMGHGLYTGRPWDAREERLLAEILSAPQVGEVAPSAVLLGEHPEPARFDHVHGSGVFALPDHQLPRFHGNTFEPRQHEPQCVRGEATEGGIDAEEIVQTAMLDLQLEVLADLQVVLHQGGEHRPVEPEELDVAAGSDGGGARRALEKPDLAETVARAEDVQRDLLALLPLLDDARATGGDDVKSVRLVTLPDNDTAEGERGRHKAVHHELPRLGRKDC